MVSSFRGESVGMHPQKILSGPVGVMRYLFQLSDHHQQCMSSGLMSSCYHITCTLRNYDIMVSRRVGRGEICIKIMNLSECVLENSFLVLKLRFPLQVIHP